MRFAVQVRKKALELLQGSITTAGATFFTSKDTPVEADGDTPTREIIIYTDDRKIGLGGTPPQFKTEVTTVVEITVEEDSKDAAEDLSDSLAEITENTLLATPDFVKLFEAIDSVETVSTYKGVNSARHVFAVVMEIKGHCTEIFEPTVTDFLAGVNIYVDSVNVQDPNGNYVKSFNYPVADPLRDVGPDGRAEISGSVEIGPVIVNEANVRLDDEFGHDILAR